MKLLTARFIRGLAMVLCNLNGLIPEEVPCCLLFVDWIPDGGWWGKIQSLVCSRPAGNSQYSGNLPYPARVRCILLHGKHILLSCIHEVKKSLRSSTSEATMVYKPFDRETDAGGGWMFGRLEQQRPGTGTLLRPFLVPTLILFLPDCGLNPHLNFGHV